MSARKNAWIDIRASLKAWRDSAIYLNGENHKAHLELRAASARIAALEARNAELESIVAAQNEKRIAPSDQRILN